MENLKEAILKKIENKGIKIDNLVNLIFKEKSKKVEIIKKLRPFFSLKVIPNREIDRVYSSLEKIDPENIDVIEINEYKEEKYCEKNLFVTKSKSVGLSDFDLNLSASILGHKQSASFQNKEKETNKSSKSSSKSYCIHSINIKLFRISIDFKNIKLAKQVTEELQAVHNSNETEKKLLLEKLVDKFGLYVPLEFIIGGRINYSFEANSEEEIRENHSILQREIEGKFGGGNKLFSASLEGSYKINNTKDETSSALDKVENLSIKIEGGDYSCKENFRKWIQSFNLDNLQIIEYKSLQPIYSFIPGLESKLSICLQCYEDIVLKEIYNLMENDFMKREQEIFEGSSELNNIWKVGITQDQYKNFRIFRKKIVKNLRIRYDEYENEEEQNKKIIDVICGEIPEGFIICGWSLKTNANSNYYDLIAKWERKKTVGIIGNEYFRFVVGFKLDEEEVYEDVDINWYLEIFCIPTNCLVRNSWFPKSNHFFINCCCGEDADDCSYSNLNQKKESFIIENHKQRKKKPSSDSNQSKIYYFLFHDNKRFSNSLINSKI